MSKGQEGTKGVGGFGVGSKREQEGTKGCA